MTPLSLGGGHVNFLTADELAGSDTRVRAAYDEDKFTGLAALKAKWEPTNLFQHNQNIRPGASAKAREGKGGKLSRSKGTRQPTMGRPCNEARSSVK